MKAQEETKIRKKSTAVYEGNLMYAIAGQLFAQAPNKQPRNAEIIMEKIKQQFRSDADNFNEFYSITVEDDKLYDWIHDLLFSIPDFITLNLSQIEYEKGISVDDESRPEFSICTIQDKYDSESWKSDFIDLDAFVQNVYSSLKIIEDVNSDCFGCISKNVRTVKLIQNYIIIMKHVDNLEVVTRLLANMIVSIIA